MENSPKVTCPKCGSESITANKKGFSGASAAAGAVLTGGIGLLAGTIGSNKVVITCLNCGNRWKPGDKTLAPAVKKKRAIILSAIFGISTIVLIALGGWPFAILTGLFTAAGIKIAVAK